MEETIARARKELEAARDWAQSFDASKHIEAAKEWINSAQLREDFHAAQESIQRSCHPDNIQAQLKSISQQPEFKQILYGALLGLVSLWAVISLYLRFRRRIYPRPSTPELEKAPTNLRKKLHGPDRKPGGLFHPSVTSTLLTDRIQNGSRLISSVHQRSRIRIGI